MSSGAMGQGNTMHGGGVPMAARAQFGGSHGGLGGGGLPHAAMSSAPHAGGGGMNHGNGGSHGMGGGHHRH